MFDTIRSAGPQSGASSAASPWSSVTAPCTVPLDVGGGHRQRFGVDLDAHRVPGPELHRRDAGCRSRCRDRARGRRLDEAIEQHQRSASRPVLAGANAISDRG
jgi:hypothetical protein